MDVSVSSQQSFTNKIYDLIIVGGGLAGSVLASRLSQVANKSILLIEAGKDRRGDPLIETPGMVTSTWGNKNYDWNLRTDPQLGGRRIPQPRGKCLGGSSAINVTAIAYPSRRDFDLWAQLGNRGWSFETMRPYFSKFQSYWPAFGDTRSLLNLGPNYVSRRCDLSGPVHTSHPDVYGPLQEAWIKSFQQSGIDNGSDPFEFRKLGAFIPPNTVNSLDSKRSHAASAYLAVVVTSRNLHILTETMVTRVLIEKGPSGAVTKGVGIQDQQGENAEIFAKEVVLSAGTFASPQILELSGIGSASILESHGIEPIVNNPYVGEGLQDHCFASISFELKDGYESMDAARDTAVVQSAIAAYQENRAGPLSGVPYSLAYAPAVDRQGKMTRQAIQDVVDRSLEKGVNQPYSVSELQEKALCQLIVDPEESPCYYSMVPAQMHVNSAPDDTTMQDNMAQRRPRNHLTIGVGLNHPLSRGNVHIKSASAGLAPAIDPKYLTHPLDAEILARGMQFTSILVDHPSFARTLKTGNTIPANVNLVDLEQTKKLVKERLWTTYHPTSTCAMLPRESGGVVNDRLEVYGVDGLRVADASTFPLITLRNIQATMYAFAERASDLTKEDWTAAELS